MPNVDDDLQRRINLAAPVPPEGGPVFEDVVRRKHRRSVTRRVSAVGVVALVLAGAIFAFAAVDRPSTVMPGASSPAPLAEDLGLPFPTCRVSSMPIGTGSGAGTAAVYTEMTNGECPAPGDGVVDVGVDVTGDGALDATWGPLPDCWLRCEAFAAPDVNGDGISEIAVSTEGADGFGVSMYSVTISPAAIAPIEVSSTFDRGPQDGEPFQFAWVDVATHASSAGCVSTTGQDPLFALYWTEKLTPAQVETMSIAIQGTIATVTDLASDTMPFDQAPMPGRDLCGAPIYGSAAGLGTPIPIDATTIPGVPFPVCRPMSIPGAFGPGLTRAWIFEGERVPGDGCLGSEGFPHIGVGDDTSVALVSEQLRNYQDGTLAALWATPDINGDGIDEIAVETGHESDSQQFVLFTLDGSAVRLVRTCTDCSYTFDWGGPGVHLDGAYCRGGSFWTWNVEQIGPNRYSGWLIEYELNGSRLDEVSRQEILVPIDDPSALPEGGGDSICGALISP